MKLFIVSVVLFSAVLAHATNSEYALSMYPKWMQDACIQLTKERTRVSYRINYPAALQCAELSTENIRQEELRQSVVEASKAAAERDRAVAKELRRKNL